MDALLYLVLVFSSIAVFGFFLWKIKLDLFFLLTFMLLTGFFLSISVWETESSAGNGWIYLTSLWGVTVVLMSISFIVTFMFYQYRVYNRIIWKKLILLILLVVGIFLLMGVLEDFFCFVIWGVEETFNPIFAWWHIGWFYGIFPIFYFMGIVGIVLIIIAFVFSYRVAEPVKLFTPAEILAREIELEIKRSE